MMSSNPGPNNSIFYDKELLDEYYQASNIERGGNQLSEMRTVYQPIKCNGNPSEIYQGESGNDKIAIRECEIENEATYNAKILEDVLLSIADKSIYDEAMNESIIRHCAAAAAYKRGSIQYALHLLKKAGERAENRGGEKIQHKDIEYLIHSNSANN